MYLAVQYKNTLFVCLMSCGFPQFFLLHILLFLYSVFKVHLAVGVSRSLYNALAHLSRRAFRLVSTALLLSAVFRLILRSILFRDYFPLGLYSLEHEVPGASRGGLKWTRTIDLTLIRRAL